MDDLIRRSDAIEYFMTNTNWNDEEGDPIDDAEDKRALLTDYFNGVQSAQQWIPVSERLPEVDVFVLVTLQHFNGETDVIIAKVVKGYFSNELEWESDNGEWTWGVECGFAWMPLPEPYKESEDKE